VVIGWSIGVSVHRLETGEELWFQALQSPMLAFGVQPQGEMAAASLPDGSIAVLSLADGQIQRYEGARPNAFWGDLAWSPDGQQIAFQSIAPGRGDPIYLLDLAGGDVRALPGSEISEGVTPALHWSPDGAWITVASLGSACPRIVDARNGEEVMGLGRENQCRSPFSLAWLADGSGLAVQGRPAGVDLLRVPDGARIRNLPGNIESDPQTINTLRVDPNGVWLASAGGVEAVGLQQRRLPPIIWDLSSGTGRAIARLLAAQTLPSLDNVRLRTFGFSGESLLFLYENGAITRWDFLEQNARETLVSSIQVIEPLKASVHFAANGSRAAFAGAGGVEVWDMETQQIVRRFSAPLKSPALSPDGRQIALFNARLRTQDVYNLETGDLVHTLAGTDVPMGAAFSPDGRLLVYGENARVKVVSIGDRVPVTLHPTLDEELLPGLRIRQIIWSPDGQSFVTIMSSAIEADPMGVLIVWRRAAGSLFFEQVFQVKNAQAGYDDPNQTLAAYNPSGNLVALHALPTAAADQSEIVVFDLDSLEQAASLKEMRPGAWVDDEVLLGAEAQFDLRMMRWNVRSGETKPGAGRDDLATAFAPGGVFFLQADQPPLRGITIKHWWYGEIRARGSHLSLNLVGYRWSPNGGWAASIGGDGSILVWPVTME
jgi:WD40 repeat protein